MEDLKSIIDKSQKEYNDPGNQNIILDDSEFDAIVEYYEQKTGQNYTTIGSRPSERMVQLPYPLPSLNKIKGKNAAAKLQSFLEKYPNIVILDKLDGISVMIVYSSIEEPKAYLRGDGVEGQDVTYIIDYIELPRLKEDIIVRGELILHKNTFAYIQETMISNSKLKKSRNLVNGALTHKDATKSILSETIFYAFEIISSMPQEVQLQKLQKYGFHIPFFQVNHLTTIDELTNILNQRRINALYEIDGIVISSNESINYSLVNENPKHKVAFKIDTLVVSQVIDIEWGLTSRYGYITPIIIIEEVDILGSDVSRISAHNAEWFFSKKAGIGAIVKVTLSGDIIPYLVDIIIPSEKYNLPNIPLRWSTKGEGKELMIINPYSFPEVHIAIISSFLDNLAIKNTGVKTIEKIFYGAQIQSVEGFLTLQEDQIASLPGFGAKSAQNIVSEIKKGIANATYPKLMAASGCFGEGIGDTVCSSFIEAFPNWKYAEITSEMIEEIKGFGSIRADQMSKGLVAFKEQWFGHPLFLHLEHVTPIIESQDFKGHTIVFSGFRDENLKMKLEKRGAKIPASFVKTTTILIVKSKSESSSKITEAQKNKIPIYSKEEFLKIL